MKIPKYIIDKIQKANDYATKSRNITTEVFIYLEEKYGNLEEIKPKNLNGNNLGDIISCYINYTDSSTIEQIKEELGKLNPLEEKNV